MPKVVLPNNLVTQRQNGPVRPDEWKFYLPLVGERMFELGGKFNKGAGQSYKSHFEALGFEHVSVDINGEYGAIVRDLRRPLWGEFGLFDMVCNIGTTEHVDGQFGVWRNVFHLTKIGGVVVSVTPYHDGRSWWWHGLHYPTEEFFREFAALNGFVIEKIGRQQNPPHENLYVRMTRRTHFEHFTMPDETLIIRNQVRPR